MNLSITCLNCCPIIFSNSEYRQGADASTQYNENSTVTASLVYAEDQVNKMQTDGGQVSQSLFNQGQEVAEVSRFVNRVELEPLKTSMGERSNSPITQGGDDRKNDEVAGRESPPPPPPLLRIDPSILSPGFYGTAPYDPIYGDRLTSIEGQREPSPLPEINTEIRSAGFMNYVPEKKLKNGVVIEYKTWTTEMKPSPELEINNNKTSAQLSSPREESLLV